LYRATKGYNYSSSFTSHDQAYQEFVESLDPSAKYSSPVHSVLRQGHYSRTWVANVIAVGGASGFVENPLTSTSLALVASAQHLLLELLGPTPHYGPTERLQLNQHFDQLYAGIRDFAILHYATCHRNDSQYWRYLHADLSSLPSSLISLLRLWDRGVASPLSAPLPYQPSAWISILDGNGRWPRCFDPTLTPSDLITPIELTASMASCEQTRKTLLTQLPKVADYITNLRARFDSGDRDTGIFPIPPYIPDTPTLPDNWQRHVYAAPSVNPL
jgi:hypothetical protein